MRISFTKRAEKDLTAIFSYLTKKWGTGVAETFAQKTADFLELLQKFPEMGTLEVVEKKIFGYQLTKQTKLFYRLKENRIIILTLFDVRQDPKKKPK